MHKGAGPEGGCGAALSDTKWHDQHFFLVIVSGRLYRTRGGWAPCIRRPTRGWMWRCTSSIRTASRTWTSASWHTSARLSPSSPSWRRCAGKLIHIVMLAVSFQVFGAPQRGRRRHPHPGKSTLRHIFSFRSLVHSRIEYMAHLSEVCPFIPVLAKVRGQVPGQRRILQPMV